MDFTRVLRAVDAMNLRIKRLEDAVTNMSPPPAMAQDLFHEREKVDFDDADVPSELIQGSPLLTSLYTSENSSLNKFCVGTWPDDASASQSMALHGAQCNVDGTPIELIRMEVIPALIQAGVPFSTVQVDADEDAPGHRQLTLVNEAASHAILLTPGAFNFKEAVLRAYLAGRGNANVHVVTHGCTPLSTPAGTDPVPNIVGPAASATQRQRVVDADETVRFLAADIGTQAEYTGFDGEDGLHSKTIVGAPDALKRTKTTDVAHRVKKWKEALETLPFKSDIAQIIGAAYVTGMVSPSQTSRFMAVNRALIAGADEWLGKARTFRDIAAIKTAAHAGDQESPQKEALQFFAALTSN